MFHFAEYHTEVGGESPRKCPASQSLPLSSAHSASADVPYDREVSGSKTSQALNQLRSNLKLEITNKHGAPCAMLTSENTKRTLQVGWLGTPSLGFLRNTFTKIPGQLGGSLLAAEVALLQANCNNRGASFQVTSQYSLLEDLV